MPAPQRLLAALLLATLAASTLSAQPTTRTLTGTVTDRHHEPLAGAVVQVHDDTTDAVLSYITTRTGRYVFKRLSTDDNYHVAATYQGHHSRSRSLSKFDAKPNRDIPLTVKLQ